MSSTKLVVWYGRTDTHGFMVDVYEDAEQGIFTAIVTASTPPMAPAIRHPGQKVQTMNLEPEYRVTSTDDLETLEALTNKSITAKFGQIRHFASRKP